MNVQNELHKLVEELDSSDAKQHLHFLVDELNEEQARKTLLRMRGMRQDDLEKWGFSL